MRVPFLSFSLAASALLFSGPSFLAQIAVAQIAVAQIAAAQTAAAQTAPAAAAVASPGKEAKPAKDLYAGEPFVIERSDWVYSENADGTGYRLHTVAVRMQSEPALREFGVISVPFASASEHVELAYVRVRHADGSTTETPAAGAIEQPEPVTKQAPFYSDLKDLQLPVKNLKVGDTLEWEAKIVRTRAEAVNQFWGQERLYSEDVVILKQAVELRVPAAVKVTVWTNPHSGVKPVESTDGDRKVYRWSLTQLKPTVGSEADAAKKLKKAKVMTDDEETEEELGKLATMAWTTFPSWEAVGAWYRGLEGKRSVPDEEIKAKVAELTAKSKTEEEKVRAVYAYVSAQVRYVGVAFGVGRYQPHEAADVLHNQYGDCKDKATLLSSMLEAIGLSPDSVLIGAGVRFNEAVPSPSAFNHLITRVKVGSDEVWLDATQEVAPYRALMFQIRDKQALVVPDAGAAKIETSPKELPFTAYEKWVAKGTINKDGTIESHLALESRGDGEIMLRSVIHQVPPSSYDELAQRLANSLGYSGTTSHAEFSRPEETTEPMSLSFDYKREKSSEWENLKIVPQFAPISLPTVDEKDPPTHPIELGQPVTQTSTSEFKLPEGWGVELPEAIHAKTAFATDDVTYRFENGTLYSERKVTVLKSKLPASEWKTYKKFTDDISLGYEKYVQLIRPNASGKAAVSTAHAHASNPEAEALVTKAFELARSPRDLKEAEGLLKQAKSMDPETKSLWAAFGWVAYLRGKYGESVEDYRKEMSLYPSSHHLYEYIARAQWAHKEKDAAVATLREWVVNDPDSPEAEYELAVYLMQAEKYAEAADAAEKALALTPKEDKEKVEARTMLLGNAQLKAKQFEKGSATLKGLLETTENAGYMNDAAYELADEKLLLPLDEEKIHEALKKMDAETQAWTLDEAPGTLEAKSNLLVASWDTMGWILYRAGKTAEAKSWIQAAYLNQFHAEVKKHLDEINGVLGVAAMDTTKKTEQANRIFPMGAYSGGKATAEYRVLLQHGKVLRTKATGTELSFVDELLKQVSFARLFPAGSDAKLVRTGIVNCLGGKCEFVMEP